MKGSDAKIDDAINKYEDMIAFLKQDMYELSDYENMLLRLAQLGA